MNNLRQLGLIVGAGVLASLPLIGCSDDTPPPVGTAGSSSGGTAAGGTGTSGSDTGGSDTGGTSAAGTSAGGGGTGGAAAGSGGGGSGGGDAGGGGTGGTGVGGGGAGGGGAGGGGAGGAGGGPSADCATWCQGADSVLTVCAQNNIPEKINSEQKCLDVCQAAPPASVTCWVTHTANAKNGDKAVHCPHGTGADNQDVCPKLP